MILTRIPLTSPRTFEKDEVFRQKFHIVSARLIDKNYGSDVKEIRYAEILVPDEIGKDNSPTVVYKDGVASCLIQPEYKEVTRLNTHQFSKLLAKKYLEESSKLCSLDIPGFDASAYLTDLKDAFRNLELI